MNQNSATILKQVPAGPEHNQLDSESGERRFMLLSIVGGAIVGFGIGVAQLVFIGSRELIDWAFMPLIPLYSALGWALFGMILGGGGTFGRTKVSHEEVQTPTTYPARPAA